MSCIIDKCLLFLRRFRQVLQGPKRQTCGRSPSALFRFISTPSVSSYTGCAVSDSLAVRFMSIINGNVSAFCSSFHIIQQAQTDSKRLSSNLYKDQHSYTQASIHITNLTNHHPHTSSFIHTSASANRTTLRASKSYININTSHQKSGTMSAPLPDSGATSSKPKNPGPQPVGPFGAKTYPKPKEFHPDKEVVQRVGTVTNVASRPWAFRVTTGGDGRLEFPTEKADHELNIKKDAVRDNGFLAVGKRYTVSFSRPVGSSDYTPYEFWKAAPRP